MYPAARQAEIVRCNQKDEYYMTFMTSSMANIMQSLFGELIVTYRMIVKYRIRMVSD